MRALVTGSAGFLGRHFCRQLGLQGYDVVEVDVATRAPFAVNALDFFRRSTTRYDLAIHCAAIVGGRHTIDRQPLKQALNLALDAAYIDWVERTRPHRAVYLSSSAAYPVRLQAGHNTLCLAETFIDLEQADEPDAGYGWQKLTGERLVAQARHEGCNITVVRPFSGYGADQSLDYPFPSFIDRAANRADPFIVWGDGTQTRDWIHVDDIVAATLAAAAYQINGPVNLGWGEPTSMGELVMMVCEQAGYTPAVECRTDAPTGVHYRVADPSRMLMFYAPKVTLDEGIARALAAAKVAA